MLKNKCCFYVIISIQFFSITICNLLIESPSYLKISNDEFHVKIISTSSSYNRTITPSSLQRPLRHDNNGNRRLFWESPKHTISLGVGKIPTQFYYVEAGDKHTNNSALKS